MTAWDPVQYRKFSSHRLRPALDLLAAVPLDAPAQVVDLGCGDGRATRLVAERWPSARIIGVDDSAAMREVAARDLSGVTWQQGRIQDWRPTDPVDLIFSNAALHWLPDHHQLFPALIRMIRPGGILAVQMPGNFDAPSHAAIREAAGAGPWRDREKRVTGDRVHEMKHAEMHREEGQQE